MHATLGDFDSVFSAFTPTPSLDDSLGDFASLWKYLEKPALMDNTEVAEFPAKVLRKKNRKPRIQEETTMSRPEIPEDLPELINSSSASDSDGPSTSSDEAVLEPLLAKSQSLTSLISTLDAETKLFRTKELPRRPIYDAASRLINVTKKLADRFPDDYLASTTTPVPGSPRLKIIQKSYGLKAAYEPSNRSTYIFVDSSNIYLGFQKQVQESLTRNRKATKRPSMDLDVLNTILERNRPNARKVLVGSRPLLQNWDKAEKSLGYEVSMLERIVKPEPEGLPRTPYPSKPRKAEQGVDELIHMKMLETLLDAPHAATMVLATGDANVAQYSEGFFSVVLRALARGWKVEVVSFRKGLSALWKDKAFRKEYEGRVSIVELDEFLEELEDQ